MLSVAASPAYARKKRPQAQPRPAIHAPEQIHVSMQRVHPYDTPCGLEASAATTSTDRRTSELSAMALRLQAHVAFLADSLQTGRGMGTPGGASAAFYIAKYLRDSGLSVEFNGFLNGSQQGRNIIGIRREAGARQYVIVMASYDGLGMLGGNIYPCADANGSGVAAMLELASDNRPHAGKPKNFIFVALDGHHAGMSGSQALRGWLARNGISRKDIVMVVNLDTMGANLTPPSRVSKEYIIALGGAPFRGSMEFCNRDLGLHISYDYYGSKAFTDMFYRRVSEQKTFLEMGVPCVMFTAGITDNTYKVTDSSATLNYPIFSRRVELIQRWMLRL